MKVLLFGGSGMLGQGVLRECLLDPRVDSVLAVGRTTTGRQGEKLQELLLPDVGNLVGVEDRLRGYDACFYCLGVSSVGISEADYRRVTYDLTVQIAGTLARLNPGMTFTYVSGAGTDSTERGRSMWARVKGQTENAVLQLPFRAAYMFRPGFIRSLHGIRSKTRIYRVLYAVILPFMLLAGAISPDAYTTTEKIGRAMIRVAIDGAPTRILHSHEINQLGG
jgi:uncharacterized protein YbjT (DUF2867 family)